MQNQDEVVLQDIYSVIWRKRRMVALTTIFFGLISLAIALLLPAKYESSVVLVPATDDPTARGGGAGALLSQVGGLGLLGGLGLGAGGKKTESLATLRSVELVQRFIEENQLLPILYADDWDAQAGQWRDSDPRRQPTLWKAQRKFKKKILSVDEDKKSGLVTLTVTWRDPAQAAEWAAGLVDLANRKLRETSLARSERNLAYLNEQLTKATLPELQKAIASLIEGELKQSMIARGNDEFGFRVVDHAVVSELKSSPKRGVITIIGAMVGLFGSLLVALAFGARKASA